MTTPDPDKTTAVPATATTTPAERVAGLVQAIKDLQPGDVRAAYKLDGVKQAAGEKYIDGLIVGIVRGARKRSSGEVIEQIWKWVLDDIVKREGRMNGAEGQQ